MDASLTATNVHVSNSYIPDDIVFSILAKLSLKSLKRFACVRKSWSLLFDNHYFMTMYRKSFLTKDHSYYEGTSLLLKMAVDEVTKYKYYLYSVSGERFENRFKLNWPKPLLENEDDPSIKIFGSINGTLCIHSIECSGFKQIILWNPTTNEVKVFPSEFFKPIHSRSHVCWTCCLVGYDRVKDDYKVIQFSFCILDDYFWEMYSLRSNSWRKIDYNIPRFYMYDQQVYMDGVTHWLGNNEEQSYLGSFNCSDESIVTTPTPSYVDNCCWGKFWRHLVILNGSIALILNNTETFAFHISILGEVGVKKSWTKLFIVEDLPCLEHFIGAGKKGKLLFRREDGELVWFDLNTKMIDEFGVEAIKFDCDILFHKESILPIGGTYN